MHFGLDWIELNEHILLIHTHSASYKVMLLQFMDIIRVYLENKQATCTTAHQNSWVLSDIPDQHPIFSKYHNLPIIATQQ